MRKGEIVQRIRSMRMDKGMTQTELAEKCNVSKSLISKVEANKASIHLDLLMDIANALGVTVSQILEETPRKKQAVIVRASDKHHWVSGVNGKLGFDYYGLANNRESKVDVFFVVIGEEARKASRFVSHEGAEFVYIVEGSLRIEFRDEDYTLRPGDTAYFDSSLDHRFMPALPDECVHCLLMLIKN